jgi:hypothetical protein
MLLINNMTINDFNGKRFEDEIHIWTEDDKGEIIQQFNFPIDEIEELVVVIKSLQDFGLDTDE